MNYETLLQILRLALRLAEVLLGRRAAKRETPPISTRADKVVARVAPLAEKVLDKVAPETAHADTQRARLRKRSRSFTLARAALFGALAAGGAACLIVKQQRRVRDRYRPVHMSFPEALLDVLAAPGGGGRLRVLYSGEGLSDPDTGLLYPVIDGIPDFIAAPTAGDEYLAGQPAPEEENGLRLPELVDPLKLWGLGINPAGNAALAGAVAAVATGGWALSVPCGLGAYEIEMARANPRARLLCVDDRWNMLLETRRKALEAGLTNLYFVRGALTLLPLQDASLASVWTANGFHLYPEPERAMTQIVRVARPGALVAGVSLVAGGPRYREALVNLIAHRLPGRLDERTHFTRLYAAGLHNLHAFRDGSFVRFSAVRA